MKKLLNPLRGAVVAAVALSAVVVWRLDILPGASFWAYRNRGVSSTADLAASPGQGAATATTVGDGSGVADGFPPSVREVFDLRRDSQTAAAHHAHPFNRPLVIATYARAPTRASETTDVFFFLTGVHIRYLGRNLTAAACVVGDDVYPLSFSYADVVHCQVPRQLRRGEPLTVALLRNRRLEQALAGPVPLRLGYQGIIEEGDVAELSPTAVLHGELQKLNKALFMPIRSLETFRSAEVFDTSESAALPRYQVCLMTQIAPYYEYLPTWIDYHRRLGVDMVYLFDNHAQEDLSQMFRSRRDVEVVYWPWSRSQTQAFTYFEIASRPRCEWVLFMDVDEFIMLGLKGGPQSGPGVKPLAAYVKTMRKLGYGQVTFPSITMMNSGYRLRPEEPVPEAYVHRRSNESFPRGKSICETDHDWVASAVWTCVAREDFVRKTFLQNRTESERSRILEEREEKRTYLTKKPKLTPTTFDDPALLVHFKQLSWEDEIIKRESPRNNLNSDRRNETQAPLDVGNPPASFLATDGADRIKYTHFRDTYRHVTTSWAVAEQTIVRFRAGKRCESTYDVIGGTKLQMRCQDVEVEA